MLSVYVTWGYWCDNIRILYNYTVGSLLVSVEWINLSVLAGFEFSVVVMSRGTFYSYLYFCCVYVNGDVQYDWLAGDNEWWCWVVNGVAQWWNLSINNCQNTFYTDIIIYYS